MTEVWLPEHGQGCRPLLVATPEVPHGSDVGPAILLEAAAKSWSCGCICIASVLFYFRSCFYLGGLGVFMKTGGTRAPLTHITTHLLDLPLPFDYINTRTPSILFIIEKRVQEK